MKEKFTKEYLEKLAEKLRKEFINKKNKVK